jgi:Protein of unknown function (DUF3887)
MKIGPLAMAVGILGCGLTLAPILRGQIPPQIAPAASDPAAEAREVLNEIVAGQYEKVEAQYNAALKAALPVGRLAADWTQLLGQTGGFKSVISVASGGIRDRQMVRLVCSFERRTLDAVITFDADGTIGGIHFWAHKDMSPWAAPVYAKPEVTGDFDHAQRRRAVSGGRAGTRIGAAG